jgi:hypothetical protein
MDLFRSPSFQPEKLDDTFLFLSLHRSSLTDFVNYPNWSKLISLPDFLSGNRLSQFPSQSYALCSSRLGSLWETERIEMVICLIRFFSGQFKRNDSKSYRSSPTSPCDVQRFKKLTISNWETSSDSVSGNDRFNSRAHYRSFNL